MEKIKNVQVDVKLNTDQAMGKAEELVQLIKSANSLVHELADALENLKISFVEKKPSIYLDGQQISKATIEAIHGKAEGAQQ